MGRPVFARETRGSGHPVVFAILFVARGHGSGRGLCAISKLNTGKYAICMTRENVS